GQFARRIRNPFEMTFRLLGRLASGQFTQERYLRQTRAKVVVNVFCNSRPIPFDRALAFKFLELPMQSANHCLANPNANRNYRGQRDRRPKPPSLIKMRQNFQRDRPGFLVPNSVVVAGGYSKCVISRWKEAILSGTARAAFNHAFVEPNQLIA